MKRNLKTILLTVFVLLSFSVAGFAQDVNDAAAIDSNSSSIAKTKKHKKHSQKQHKRTKRNASKH